MKVLQSFCKSRFKVINLLPTYLKNINHLKSKSLNFSMPKSQFETGLLLDGLVFTFALISTSLTSASGIIRCEISMKDLSFVM
jgi:hypothetical protein